MSRSGARYASSVPYNLPTRIQLPGPAAVPTLTATTPPTVTVGAPNAASGIAGNVFIPAVLNGVFNAARYRVYGTVPTIGNAYPNNTGISSNDGNTNVTSDYDGQDYTVEIFTDAPVFEINVKAGNAILRVLADGQYIHGTSTASGWASDNSGNGYLIKYDYAGVRQFRQISIQLAGNSRFYGVNIGPNDTLLPGPASPRTLLVFGDSFSEPTIVDTANPLTMGHMGFGVKLGYMLGIRHTVYSGSGGAGFIQAGGTGYRPPFPQRSANDIGKFRPDLCVIHAGINDTEPTTSGAQAAYQTAIEQTLAAAWTNSPDTRFYLSLNGTGANYKQGIETVYQRVAAAHPGRVYYLDRLSPRNIYTGTGRQGTTTGTGNSDLMVGNDGTHPTLAGHDMLARELFTAISETLP